MTKGEFARESDPRGETAALGCVIVPCGCGDAHCPGWQWVTRQQAEHWSRPADVKPEEIPY